MLYIQLSVASLTGLWLTFATELSRVKRWRIVPDGAATPVGDNLFDDSDNSEDLDDLDIFMRDNKVINHYRDCGCDCLSCSRHNNYNDWNSGSYSQSYDDFHDEHDDYNMMDDDF